MGQDRKKGRVVTLEIIPEALGLLDYEFVILLFGKRKTRFLQFVPCRNEHGMNEVSSFATVSRKPS